MDTRRDLLESFVGALNPLGILDRFQLAGVVASWWGGDTQYEAKTLAHHGFGGVVQGWLTTIEAAFEADEEDDAKDARAEARNAARIAAEKRRAREHPCVPLLIPDYLAALEQAEARKADLDAQVKAATAKPSEDEEDDGDDFEQGLSALDLKMLKANQAAARKEVRRLEAEFLDRLKAAITKLDPAEEETLVLQILRDDLTRRLESTFDAGPRALVARYRTWADKYAVPLFDLQHQQSVAEAAFSAYLKDLGYA